MVTTYSEHIWKYLMEVLNNEYGVAGLMGNLYAESALRPNNLQGSYETSLGFTDESYTQAVDTGSYSEHSFVTDSAGYGLAQWTYSGRKQWLYTYWQGSGYASIGDIDLQLDFLVEEMQSDFSGVWNVLKNATSIREASDKVLHDFESPADQSESVEEKRYVYAQSFYDTYNGTGGGGSVEDANALIISSAVSWAVGIANDDSHGYDQEDRWGLDYDCSSLVIQAYEQAGCPVKTNGATYTGNMESVFVETGFDSISYYSGMELLKGDVLLRSGHTAMYIGDGKIVSAHINELGEVVGGETGDQTGNEINVSSFSSSGSWVTVLRLPSTGGSTGTEPETSTKGKLSKLLLFAILTDRF